MDLKNYVIEKAKNVKIASRKLAVLNTAEKDKALKLIAEEINNNRELIKKNNSIDVENAIKKGLS